MKSKAWTSSHAKAAKARRGIPLMGKSLEWVCQRKVIDRYKRRAIGFNMEHDECVKIMESNCSYCGVAPNQCTLYKAPYRTQKWLYNGLDRVDNMKGYENGNVVACCRQCNIAKNNYTIEEFYVWIKRVVACSGDKCEI